MQNKNIYKKAMITKSLSLFSERDSNVIRNLNVFGNLEI